MITALFRNRTSLALACACMLGCTAPQEPLRVTHEDPAVKIPAMRKVVRERDLGAAPQLVRDLESDDPAVRFYAIQALRELTGESYGYRYYLDERQREPYVRQWRQWLAQQEGGGEREQPAGRMPESESHLAGGRSGE